jgi:hypothetical protein
MTGSYFAARLSRVAVRFGDELSVNPARLGGGVDCRLGGLEIIGQLVAFGDVLAVAEGDMADQPYFVFRFVVGPAVARGDLGLGDDSHRPCRFQALDARVGRGAGLSVGRLFRSLSLSLCRWVVTSLRWAVVEKDRHRRAGHFRVALNDDDVAGVDRLVFLVVVDEFVRIDRDRLLRVCPGEDCGGVAGARARCARGARSTRSA